MNQYPPEGVLSYSQQHGCDWVVGTRPAAEDNHSRADVQYSSTTSSVILLLHNSCTILLVHSINNKQQEIMIFLFI